MQVGEALQRARAALAPLSDTAAGEARSLLADALGRTPTWVLAHDTDPLEESEVRAFEQRLRRRANGEPLPYILGRWEFYGRSFEVTPDVLIPRPETELLVEAALGELRGRAKPIRALDVGTGSGCVAVTLAAEVAGLRVFAGDVSRAALRVARRNARRHRVEENVALVQMSVLEGFRTGWDLICANLPYLPEARLETLPVAAWEPRLALDGGPAGTAATGRLVSSLGSSLARDGVALLEIDQGQAEGLIELARSVIRGASFEVRQDLHGLERLLVVRKSTGP